MAAAVNRSVSSLVVKPAVADLENRGFEQGAAGGFNRGDGLAIEIGAGQYEKMNGRGGGADQRVAVG